MKKKPRPPRKRNPIAKAVRGLRPKTVSSKKLYRRKPRISEHE